MHGLGDADLDLVAALPRARDVYVRTRERRGIFVAECAATGSARTERGERLSAQDVQAAIEKVFASKKTQAEGIALAQECLKRVGAARVRDVAPELRATLIKVCNEELAKASA